MDQGGRRLDPGYTVGMSENSGSWRNGINKNIEVVRYEPALHLAENESVPPSLFRRQSMALSFLVSKASRNPWSNNGLSHQKTFRLNTLAVVSAERNPGVSGAHFPLSRASSTNLTRSDAIPATNTAKYTEGCTAHIVRERTISSGRESPKKIASMVEGRGDR